MSRVFEFPNPVSEVAARSVAAGVALISATTIVLGLAVGHGWLWISLPLALGFLARVLSGPTLSPLGQLATRVVAPRVGHEKLVPGPPKRFAQAMGLTMTGAAVAFQAMGSATATMVLLGTVTAAATLESVFALCLGCIAFGYLMRIGVIPEETCEACADVSLRLSRAA